MATRKKTKPKVEKKEVVALTSIEVLCLKGLEAISTLLMLHKLLCQGYMLVINDVIYKDPLNNDPNTSVLNLTFLGGIGFLKFDHEHKLMHVVNEDEAKKTSAGSMLQMTVTTDVEYSSPTPHHPDQLNVGTAVYIRVV